MFRFHLRTILVVASISFLFSFSCQHKEDVPKQVENIKNTRRFIITSPKRGSELKQSSNLKISWEKEKSDFNFDSVKIQLDDLTIAVRAEDSSSCSLALSNHKTGHRSLRVTFYADSISENHIIPVVIFADKPPVKLKFKVLNTYEHDDKAYTQGLFFYKNYLYESTGKRTESSLRKVNPSTGDVLQQYKLKDNIFGEGIAKINDKIYMLSYTSHIGFIFDFESFELIREFPLQTTQGWGLTTFNDELLLSDGTSKLYFYEPEDFIQVNSLDVCTDKKFIDNLNELEYTNQGVFANIYTTHQIVRIDIETGAVTGTIDLSTLYPKNVTFDYDHVLNGIAWNKTSNTFYVTGKYWPVLYQIQITE